MVGLSSSRAYGGPYHRPVDFSWTAEQVELRARARKVAEEAVARYGRHNDSWINGFSREFSRELAAHGWIGMTWPVEHGGGGRPPIERLIVAEEMISAGAPIAASWFADRQMGPTLITYGTPEQVGGVPAPHPVRRDHVVHRHERARGRLRPCRARRPGPCATATTS